MKTKNYLMSIVCVYMCYLTHGIQAIILSQNNINFATQWGFDMSTPDSAAYAAGLAEPTLEKIVSGGLLAPEGMVIVERSAQIPLAPIKGLYVDREKKYKTTVITFLRPEESAT